MPGSLNVAVVTALSVSSTSGSASRATGYIPASIHLNNENADAFLQNADKALPLVIYCYHGNSSQNAADWLGEQGFSNVVSLDGGYDVFRQQFPECLEEMA